MILVAVSLCRWVYSNRKPPGCIQHVEYDGKELDSVVVAGILVRYMYIQCIYHHICTCTMISDSVAVSLGYGLIEPKDVLNVLNIWWELHDSVVWRCFYTDLLQYNAVLVQCYLMVLIMTVSLVSLLSPTHDWCIHRAYMSTHLALWRSMGSVSGGVAVQI